MRPLSSLRRYLTASGFKGALVGQQAAGRTARTTDMSKPGQQAGRLLGSRSTEAPQGQVEDQEESEAAPNAESLRDDLRHTASLNPSSTLSFLCWATSGVRGQAEDIEEPEAEPAPDTE